MRTLFLAGAGLLLAASSSPARTWYITPDGSGDAPTIQAGPVPAGGGWERTLPPRRSGIASHLPTIHVENDRLRGRREPPARTRVRIRPAAVRPRTTRSGARAGRRGGSLRLLLEHGAADQAADGAKDSTKSERNSKEERDEGSRREINKKVDGLIFTYRFTDTGFLLFQVETALIDIGDQGNGLGEVDVDGLVL